MQQGNLTHDERVAVLAFFNNAFISCIVSVLIDELGPSQLTD
jgi:hypothetical protein